MSEHVYNDRVRFDLPDDRFVFEKSTNDDGKDEFAIQFRASGPLTGLRNSLDFQFKCLVSEVRFDPQTEEMDPRYDSAEEPLADLQLKSQGRKDRRIRLMGTPKTLIIGKIFTLPGFNITTYLRIAYISLGEGKALRLFLKGGVSSAPIFEMIMSPWFYDLLRSVRVDGQPLPMEGLTNQAFFDALTIRDDQDGEPVADDGVLEYTPSASGKKLSRKDKEDRMNTVLKKFNALDAELSE